MTDYILGLDLAGGLSGAALAPVDWGGDWDKVTTVTSGYKLPRLGTAARADCEANRAQWEAERALEVSMDIDSLMTTLVLRPGLSVHVYAETMFVGSHPSAILPIAYVRGAVLTSLAGMGAIVHDVSASEWRKLLLGSPNGLRHEVKLITRSALVASGAPPDWCEDEYDAAAVMNWGMAQHGGQFYSCPKPVKP